MKVHPLIGIGFFILIGVLIIALARGCSNERRAASAVIDIKGRITNLYQDSIEQAKQLEAYKDTIKFNEGQLSISKNKELALNEDLDKANGRISILLRKHVPIKPSPSDTGIITVPMEYVNECADCFNELDNGVQLVRKYKAEKDNQEQIYKSQLGVKDNRIKTLELYNTSIEKDYKSLLDSASTSKRKGMMYFSFGVLWTAYVPRSAGAGLMYQDKRLRQYGVKGYFGAHKPIIETQVNLPLSLRKIK